MPYQLESCGDDRIVELEELIATGNITAAANAAHALKGAAGVLSADALCELSATIEAAGRTDDLNCQIASVHELRNEMQRCLDFIQQYRREHPNG